MIERFHDQRDWFFEKRLGLFVHWGLYAIHGWHEQEMWRKHIRRPQYVKLVYIALFKKTYRVDPGWIFALCADGRSQKAACRKQFVYP